MINDRLIKRDPTFPLFKLHILSVAQFEKRKYERER